jgi:hypothetical protein
LIHEFLFDCQRCRLETEGQAMRGCEATARITHEIGPLRLDRCPLALLAEATREEHEWIGEIARLASAYRHGCLVPYPADYSPAALYLIDLMRSQGDDCGREWARLSAERDEWKAATQAKP